MSDRFDVAQERLDDTMRKAQASEDRELARWIREDGMRFTMVLAGLLRLIKVHALDNDAFTKPTADFITVQRELIERLGAVHLVAVDDQSYLNDVRLRFDERGEAEGMSTLLKRHGVGGVSFHSVLTREEVGALVECWAADPDKESPRQALAKALDERGLKSVQVFGVFRFRMQGEDKSDYTAADVQHVLNRTRGAVTEAWDNMGHGRLPNPLPLRRAVTEMLEGGIAGSTLWEDWETSSRHGAHSTRVARLALLMGTALDLSEAQLQDLGVAAVFHDVGYAAREGADPETGHPGYVPPFERHGSAGARLLLRQRGFHEARVHRLLAVMEHHEAYDSRRGKPSLFGRILRICEDYDNLTYSEECRYSPAVALTYMSGLVGREYDPILFQLFLNQVGAFPPGTLLELSDGREVRSEGLCRGPDTFSKPQCVVVREDDGSIPPERIEVDLAEEDVRVKRVIA